MVKLSTPLAILAIAIAGVAAQGPASSGGSAAAPSPAADSKAAPASSAQPTSAPPKQGGDNNDNGGDSKDSNSDVCSMLYNTDEAYKCTASSTQVPPFNLPSLLNFFIGKYSSGPKGYPVSEVADELAGSVLTYYPTVTVSSSAIQMAFYKGLIQSIRAQGNDDFTPQDDEDIPKETADQLEGMGVNMHDAATKNTAVQVAALGLAGLIAGAVLL
ncbi:hypothetical protein MVES1_001098 [Malassezia vespertilionis]|uniref:Uncharacterized protein n=1 Tax=Malassezia vespertilionis TaxID=2020962 RepID=A0A2N1JF00_9BASI|nr:uncharacterized protein MVES1_001098 [Malassezia vespertilionis]PKI85131.1 hypothetical protein MVES_001033 [Malassezia vespertilionis]WFD05765.1 hypothetical protein MVES1_001098 [Malassezia vespertilionis]